MRIGVCCPTYKRPLLVGRVIHCFLQQTYGDFKLFVIDDAGQYQSKDYGRWEMVSLPTRFPNLAAKRQFGADLLDSSYDAYMIADDDDVYFPDAVAAAAKAMENRTWAQCRVVYETVGPATLAVTIAYDAVQGANAAPRYWGYGGCWQYRLQAMRAVGGYETSKSTAHDDIELATKFYQRFGPSADSTPYKMPFYWYNRDPGVNKVSSDGLGFWEIRARLPFEKMACPPIGWNGPDLYTWTITPGIHPRPF